MKANKDESIELRTLQIPAKGCWHNDHSGWSLFWISRGRSAVEDRSHIKTTESGGVAIVPPGVSSVFKADGGSFQGHVLCFNVDRLPCMVASGTRTTFQHFDGRRTGVIVLPKGNSLTPLLQTLIRNPLPDHLSNGSRNGKTPQRLSCPCSFMLQIGAVFEELKAVIGQPGGATGEAGRKVMHVLVHLSETELQELNVGELARRCGFSRRHLARLVKNECGTSLATLVAQTRLDKAADLLRDPERKIVNVAMDCGFKHLGAFSAKFRVRFGMTPSDWRKSANGSR